MWTARTLDSSDTVCVKMFLGQEAEKVWRVEMAMVERQLNHPHILKGLGGGYGPLKKRGVEKGKRYYIVTEWAEGGELFELVRLADSGLRREVCRRLFGQIIAGLGCLHEEGIAHRDMKLENCFLDSQMHLKVADFGTCKDYKGQVLRTMVGTTDYCAPEIENNTDHESYDGPPADIFSCGVILFVLLTGKFPYDEVEDKMHKDFLWAPA